MNERIQAIADDQGTTEILCELSNTDCSESIELTDASYEWIRSHSTWFVVKLDHEFGEIERVISRNDGYAVVEKVVAKDYMEEIDPRSEGPAGT